MTDKTQNPELDGVEKQAGQLAPLLAPPQQPCDTSGDKWGSLRRLLDDPAGLTRHQIAALQNALADLARKDETIREQDRQVRDAAAMEHEAGQEAERLRATLVEAQRERLDMERERNHATVRAEQAERQVREIREGIEQAIEANCRAMNHTNACTCDDARRAALSGVSGPTETPLSETTRRRSEASAKAWERRRAARPTTEGASE